MGGSGSTRWGGQQTRRQADLCLVITPPRQRDLDAGLLCYKLVWEWYKFSARLRYVPMRSNDSTARAGEPDFLNLRLEYYREGEFVKQTISLYPTRPHYGGRWWWFRCPTCPRRAAKLYLPKYYIHFRCRICYDLTYESAQMSRNWSYNQFKRQAAELGITTREGRDWVRSGLGGRVSYDQIGKVVDKS